MPHTVSAATTIGPGKTELRQYAFPEVLPDGGVLKIESAGVCGSDWASYKSNAPPRIMGHENVGRIYKIGPLAERRWGLREGDRVALEEYLPCGQCGLCRSGEFRLCERTESRRPGALRYGTTPISEAPALWGGFSQYQFLHPDSVFHRLPESVPAALAAMCIPLGNGIQWMQMDGGAGPGKTVLIQGPGQQGLACVIAARAAGTDCIVVSGLRKDVRRLEIAKALGADYAINIEDEDLEDCVRTATRNGGFDISIDTAGAANTLSEAIRHTGKNGIVLFAATPQRTPSEFRLSALLAGRVTLRPCRGHSYAAVELALRYITDNRFPLNLLSTHRFRLDEVDLAVRSVGGEGVPGAIHVTVSPWE